MIRPMPFWPSLEPWAKDTPVHVRISTPRIHHGGGVRPSGAWYSALRLTSARSASNNRAAQAKPISGENSRA
ncbi:hypothetical protein D3C81_2258220 [compost metagenome]